MWIQLLVHRRLPNSHGTRTFYKPGDIVEVKNKTVCQELIDNGVALDMTLSPEDMPPGMGVVLRGEGRPGWVSAITLDVTHGDFGVPYPLTLILDPKVRPHRGDLQIALTQMGRRHWDVAAPILSYERTAANVGSPQDRERTAAIIPSLHSVVYDTRLIIARRNERTEALFEQLAQERLGGGDLDLAFLRALYQTRPRMWALQKELIRDRG